MKTKLLIIFIITLSFLIITSAVLINKTFAQETKAANIQYPVEELNGCEDETACRAYCDKPSNADACLDFAQKNNLISDEEITRARKFLEAGGTGPGGCIGKNACETYCNDISHIDECISFAEENDLIPPEELEEAKKVQSAIRRGVVPPPCGNKKACDTYCDNPEHMEECIAFGIEAGFIEGKELEDVQKMLAAVKRGVKPPPCRGREACDEYCSNPDNMEVCMNFAMEAGFMPEQEKADAQKMLQAIKKGIKPPNCRGREECDVYCSTEEHFEECFQFAEAAGFMTAEDAAMARKTKGKGPGNCKGKEECETFCNNPDNQETCFNFAKEHGMIPEADLKQMEEGKQQFKETMTQMPSEVADCLKSLVGEETFEKFKTGAAMPPREIGDKMRECFEKMGPPREPGESGEGGMIPPAGQTGPGGCKTPEECKTYCEANPEECQKFKPGPGAINPAEQMMPQQAGPGGCKGPEECKVFCESNPEQCQNFQSPENQIPPNQPCEGDNCQYGPPPQGQIPTADQQQLQQFAPGTGPDQQFPSGQQPPSDGSVQPPPPPPASSFLNPESFLGSVLYVIAKALYSLR